MLIQFAVDLNFGFAIEIYLIAVFNKSILQVFLVSDSGSISHSASREYIDEYTILNLWEQMIFTNEKS